jgi:5-hydroxyisourate hydrolase/2-oxo-4-hydroxy-4-carboxy-5-ureidoimidazoline decarboxylase
MMQSFPFADEKELVSLSIEHWYNDCREADWLEAFSHHPKIGDVKSLIDKFASTKHLAANEQASVQQASPEIISQLAQANHDYEIKNGFIFIVCATGKPASGMLNLLQDRMQNSRDEELSIAMGEQQKITILRLKKLMEGGDWNHLAVSQVTTHVLDTSEGIPVKEISIRLKRQEGDRWLTLAQGITNNDGRIPDLLPPSRNIPKGNYKMVFSTGNYYAVKKIKTFYPEVEIQFTIDDDSHYHVPLLINPFGFSTYRGS